MISLPSHMETHRMIMQQKCLALSYLCILSLGPPSPPRPPKHPSHCCLSILLCLLLSIFLHSNIHPSSSLLSPSPYIHLPTFSELQPFGAGGGNTPRDFGQIWWCSFPTVAFNQSKSYFGDEQRGSCFFHELLYNGITQPEGQVPHHRGLDRLRWSSYLKMNFEYGLARPEKSSLIW